MIRLIYLLIILLFGINITPQVNASVSYSLTIQEGLIDNSIYTIAQDKRGFMWFGSWKGLSRYDTRGFKNYKNDPNDPRSISSDFIKSSYTDSRGMLWFGTNWGLNRYDPVTDSFERFFKDDSNKNSLGDNTILSFMEDRKGNLWIGTDNGLSRLRISDGKVSFSRFLYAKSPSQKNKDITSIYEDPEGKIWVVASHELMSIDLTGDQPQFQLIPFKDNAGEQLFKSILSLYGDKEGNMWIGSDRHGIGKFDRKTKQFHSFRNAPENIGRKAGFLMVQQIVSTKNGILWLRTNRGTICFNASTDKFEVCSPGMLKENRLPDHGILRLYVDSHDNVWAGTYADGVKYIPPYSDFFTPIPVQDGDVGIQQVLQSPKGELWFQSYGNDESGGKKSTWLRVKKEENVLVPSATVPGDCSRSYFDSQGNLWLGLFGNILVNYKVESGRLIELGRYQLPHVSKNIADWITAFTEDKNGLVVGTANNGLYIFDSAKRAFLPYRIISRTQSGVLQKHITFLLNDSKDNLWVATSYGVTKVNGKTGKRQYFETANSVQESASTRTVNSVQEDNKGRIWMILSNDGLYMFDEAKNQFIARNQSKEINGHNITNIQHDNNGNLWLSSELGLVEYNTEKNTSRQYFFHEGIPGTRMMSNSVVKGNDGVLFFTTNNGAFYFNPNQIPFNNEPPPLAFTDLRLFNKAVVAGDQTGLLQHSFPETTEITFHHNQSIFSIDFAVLNFTNADKNQYAYKLDGLETEWNYVKTPTATYTKLPSGKYTLLIKGANNDGVWNTAGSALGITVLPPWWNTWYAWVIYILVASTIIYYLTRFFWLKNVFEKEKQLQDVKLNFFTNISHEIRTRLMLISGPVEQLLRSQKVDGDELKLLQIVNNSSDNLLKLVNELMDFRKMEGGVTRFVIGQYDIVAFVRNVMAAFEHLASSQGVETSLVSSNKSVMIWFDPDQFQKVIYNLLSNAYKFTPEGGRICISIKENTENVEIEINDNGIGIAPEYLEKLFDNYFQVAESKVQNTGYGVGLALAKSIVENLNGSLVVSSQQATDNTEGWTTFRVTLQKGNGHFKPEQLLAQSSPIVPDSATKVVAKGGANELFEDDKKYTVLFVDDNEDLREFVGEALAWQYNVITAENGEEALTIAMEHLPDLIVSDVMMAELDGLQLCERLKSDLQTSHIPVILLTAKATEINQLEGLESGADLYLTKPLSMRLLELSIKNLLKSRKAMQAKYSRHISLSDPIVNVGNSKDDEFLNNITKFVEDNIQNKEIGVPELCRHVGMSKSVLYKKLRALTDMTINDFVKIIRFKVAARLLQDESLSVQDVAFLVGYDDRKYFSKEFKKHFGKTPSEYAS